MKTKLAVFLNDAFKYVLIFFIFFIWINYYYNNFIGSVVISIILTSILNIALTQSNTNKTNKSIVSNQEKLKIKDISTQLLFSTLKENLDLFEKAFIEKGIPAKQTNYGLILYPEKEEKILFIPSYVQETIDESLIITAFKLSKELSCPRTIISGINFTDKSKNLANSINNLKIVLLNESDVYKILLKPNNLFPEKKVLFKKSAKLNTTLFFSMLLDKKNTKSYFISGIMLMFASLFIYLGTYYLIFSTVMFVLSFFSFYGFDFNGKKDIKVFKNKV